MADKLFSFFWPRKSTEVVADAIMEPPPPTIENVDPPLSATPTNDDIATASSVHAKKAAAPRKKKQAAAKLAPPSPASTVAKTTTKKQRKRSGAESSLGTGSSTRVASPSPRSKPKSTVQPAPPSPVSNNTNDRSGSSLKLPPSPSSLPLGEPISLPVGNDVEFENHAQSALKELLASVPAKTLHNYLLSRVSKLPPSDLMSLSAVLSELEPPPVLHCARCHHGFTEVENTHHSCTVPHDDDSAVVQYASSARNKAGMKGHETFWGCCGQTVEGEGELGPPSGWCYEGLHTVDRKRARWRDDSTLNHDKLISCEKRGCFSEQKSRSPRKVRDRGTKRLREETDESESEDNVPQSAASVRRQTSRSPSVMSVRSTRSLKKPSVSVARSVRSRVARSVSPDVLGSDVELPPAAPVEPPAKKRKTKEAVKKPPAAKNTKRPLTPITPLTPEALQTMDASYSATPSEPGSPKKKLKNSMKPRSRPASTIGGNGMLVDTMALMETLSKEKPKPKPKPRIKKVLQEAMENESVASTKRSAASLSDESEAILNSVVVQKTKKRRIS